MNRHIGGVSAAEALAQLDDMTAGVVPINADEFRQRITKACQLMQQQQLETLLASYRKEQQDYLQTQLQNTQQQQASQLILLKDYLTEQQTKERRTDMLELVEYLNQQRQSDWHYWQENYQPSQARLELGASPNTQNR
mgnify:CR=1 FL=1